MPESVHEILSRLRPISDKVIRRPLAEEELHALEAAANLPLPPCLRDFYQMVGLFQDLTDYGASEYELFDRADRFRRQREHLVADFASPDANLFPFADDGAGNVIAVAEDGTLYFADHETRELKSIGSFYDWLSSVVEAALTQERPSNSEKRWCVQFSFSVSDPESILKVMRQFGNVELRAWSSPKILPSKVKTSEAALRFGNEQLLLKRSEYHTWEQPMFSFDYEEPIDTASSVSLIRKLDTAFQKAGLGYKLVDYGPLSLDECEEEPANEKTKAPWARFWSKLMRPF